MHSDTTSHRDDTSSEWSTPELIRLEVGVTNGGATPAVNETLITGTVGPS